MELPTDDKVAGLYLAIVNTKGGLYPRPFHYAGDEHESAWGFAQRTGLIKEPIVCVFLANKFGNKISKLLDRQSINRGCTTH